MKVEQINTQLKIYAKIMGYTIVNHVGESVRNSAWVERGMGRKYMIRVRDCHDSIVDGFATGYTSAEGLFQALQTALQTLRLHGDKVEREKVEEREA